MNATVGPSMAFAPFKDILQVAYVTPNLEAAIAAWSTGFGISQYMRLPDLAVDVGVSAPAILSIALAWVGTVQLELIEPRGGQDGIFRDWLSGSNAVMRFHHIARLIADEREFERFEAEVARVGAKVAVRGRNGDQTRYLYTDHVAELGHYVEHIWYGDEVRQAVFAHIPRN